jgi:thiamine pyrophosphokinase
MRTKLNRRKVYDTTQYLTDTGLIVAEFHDRDAHAIFCLGITHRTDLTIYDMDRKEVVYGLLSEMLK